MKARAQGDSSSDPQIEVPPADAAGGTSSHLRVAYPECLERQEQALVLERRAAAGVPRDAPLVGLALSGGGIRSATFGLGVLQALAHGRLLGRIDFLSTVSGGGYIGAFLGRLFTREQIRGVRDVEAVLISDEVVDEEHGAGAPDRPRFMPGRVFRWLRENGRHLSPNGAGDLLLGGAVILRNFVALQVVGLMTLLALWLSLQLPRIGAEWAIGPAGWAAIERSLASLPGGDGLLWWSPWTIGPVLTLLFVVTPFAWAYWIVADDYPGGPQGPATPLTRGRTVRPIWGLVTAIVVFTAAAGASLVASPGFTGLCALVAATGAITLIVQARARSRAWSETAAASRTIEAPDGFARRWFAPLHPVAEGLARRILSEGLRGALMLCAVLLAVAVVDTLGQSAYRAAVSGDGVIAWAAALVGALAAVGTAGRRMAMFLGRNAAAAERASLPMGVVAAVLAGILAVAVLTLVAGVAHGIAWNFQPPAPPTTLSAPSTEPAAAARAESRTDWNRLWRWAVPAREATANPAPVAPGGPPRSAWPALVGTPVAFLLAWLFGATWPFLNRSSLHSLYTARLVRAYLGGSNPRRVPATGGPDAMDAGSDVTHPLPGDDIPLGYYYGRGPKARSPFAVGAPLHLVNVTVNETVEGRSNIQQNDRKGLGLAVGPAGLSLGVRHHVVLGRDGNMVEAVPPPNAGFRVFDVDGARPYPGEALSLGAWVGISGAAFSTGLGSRTNLAMSLLAGFFNVRTGYWWDSGVDPLERAGASRRSALRGAFERLLPLQSYLADELLARFRGTARRWWYLSDGGHFENLAGYELIRRRLPVIIVVDAEADPDYRFEGLANLVRKARLDFGAEVRFLDEGELAQLPLPDSFKSALGSLEMLRRGPWKEEPIPASIGKPARRWAFGPAERRGRSLASAALARIRYDDESGHESWLLYLKPALIGGEPIDVRQYQDQHPDFPHESTADQFFDEAQWESYRRLGLHVMEKLLGEAGLDAWLAAAGPPAGAGIAGDDGRRAPARLHYGHASSMAGTTLSIDREIRMKYLHTMVRISDVEAALDFYCNKLGLVELSRKDSEAGRYTLIFLCAPEDLERAGTDRAPLVELTFNWDPEDYQGGRNFGHLAYAVDNLYAACERLRDGGVTINRPPRDGRMAFVRSPDGISIELLQKGEALPPREPWTSMPNVGAW